MQTAQSVLDRITDYLGNGGLFNPEMMEHDKVRALIMDARDVLTQMSDEQDRYRLGLQQISGFSGSDLRPTPEARMARAALTDPNFGAERGTEEPA